MQRFLSSVQLRVLILQLHQGCLSVRGYQKPFFKELIVETNPLEPRRTSLKFLDTRLQDIIKSRVSLDQLQVVTNAKLLLYSAIVF